MSQENSPAVTTIPLQRITTNYSDAHHPTTPAAPLTLSEMVLDEVIVEHSLLVRVENAEKSEKMKGDKVEQYPCVLKLLCTPTDLEDLVVGALFSENIIAMGSDIVSVAIQNNIAQVKIKSPPPTNRAHAKPIPSDAASTLATNSTIADLCGHVAPNSHFLKNLGADRVVNLMAELHRRQQVFPRTGAAHAAMLVSFAGEIVCFAEDIGRHNAIDKVVGSALLQYDLIPPGCGLILSSRISFELVSKAARAGVELIAAVSAPSSLAIAAADYWGITLCGFVRRGKINVYTHAARVVA